MSADKKNAEVLKEDPGNPVFAVYAESLRKKGKSLEAIDVCLRGLSHNPALHKGRLLLARLFYEQRYLPFAIREVEQLCEEVPGNQFLLRLLDQLSPESNASRQANQAGAEDDVIAEADFEFDELEMIDEEGEESD